MKTIPKDPKGSVRAKYNRRKLWAGHALEQLKFLAEELLSQRGSIYKQKEAENILAAIERFTKTTGIELPQEAYQKSTRNNDRKKMID